MSKSNEDMKENYEAFMSLRSAVKKGKHVDSFITTQIPFYSSDSLNKILSRTDNTVSIYDFEKGVRIVVESDQKRKYSNRRDAQKDSKNENIVSEINHYYILKDGCLLTEEKKIIETVKDVTGIDLPAIDSQVKLTTILNTKEIVPVMHDRFITDVTRDEFHPTVDYRDFSVPNDQSMKNHAKNYVRDLLEAHVGFGSRSCADFGGKTEDLPKAVERMFPGLFREVEDEVLERDHVDFNRIDM